MKAMQFNIYRSLNFSFYLLLLSIIGVGTALYSSQRQEIANAYYRLNTNFIEFTASVIYNSLGRYENELIGLTKAIDNSESLNKIVDKKNKVARERIQQALHLMPDVMSLTIADMEGNYFRLPALSKKQLAMDYDPRKRSWFIQYANFSERVYYQAPTTDFFSGSDLIYLSAPVFNKNSRQSGVISTSISPKRICRLLTQFSSPVQGQVYITDAQGKRIICGNSHAELFVPVVKAVNGLINDEGLDKTFIYRKLPHSDWYIVNEIDNKTFSALVMKETIRIVYGMIFSIFVLVLIWIGMRAVFAHIHRSLTYSMGGTRISKEASLAELLGGIVERRNQLKLDSMRDALTGLLNRRIFDLSCHNKIAKGAPFSMALIDIDNFKQINDTWGHVVGDVVLRQVSKLALDVLKTDNTQIFRYGGEEFAILFANMDVQAAWEALEMLRKKVEQQSWEQPELQVSFSAGLAAYQQQGAEAFLKVVDNRLYEAKRAGKNRIVMGEA